METRSHHVLVVLFLINEVTIVNVTGVTDWESVGLIVGGQDHTWLYQDIQCQDLHCLDAHSALDIINFAVLD